MEFSIKSVVQKRNFKKTFKKSDINYINCLNLKIQHL